ncbi:hypothetical protein GCM10009122_51880 [Fulvivirga kasyanovii]
MVPDPITAIFFMNCCVLVKVYGRAKIGSFGRDGMVANDFVNNQLSLIVFEKISSNKVY